MSLANALSLLKEIDTNKELRSGMYSCSGAESLQTFLKSKQRACSYAELEEAINSQHVQCQTLEQAQELLHKADLLRYIFRVNQ